MSLTEFDLIRRYFLRKKTTRHSATVLGIGDDCALLSMDEKYELAVTIDTMVEGTHFFPGVNPVSLGHKALAVNLSDLAAMGADPRWITLGLTLPNADEGWLNGFARGLFQLADKFSVDLIGGDTTRGPLAVSIQALGVLPKSTALFRGAAQTGDLLFVTGYIGDAGIGLLMEQQKLPFRDEQALRKLHFPQPQVNVGLAIRTMANACIDISDGLLADLGHILEESNVGATINFEKIPFSHSVQRYIRESCDWRFPLGAGDDYELCFTVESGRESELHRAMSRLGTPYTCIGRIEETPGIRLLKEGELQTVSAAGYRHFSAVERGGH
ncbi:MAG: thiamine-phosphate kinase [Methylococcales bacterium]